MKYSFSLIAGNGDKKCKAPSYSGLVRRPLTAVTRVRIPLGSRLNPPELHGSGDFFCPGACPVRWTGIGLA